MSQIKLVILLMLLACSNLPGQIFRHRQKTCNKFLIPNTYPYAKDQQVGQSRVIGKADLAQNAGISGAPSATEKRFHIPTTGVATDRVRFERIGVHINSEGEAKITGRLVHTGGPDGGLSGSNVTIFVRLISGVQDADNVNDAVVVWEGKQKNWCYRNRGRSVSITNSLADQLRLQRVFQKITHVEIELEHEVDR